MDLQDHMIIIPVDNGTSNLFMVWDPSVSSQTQKELGLKFVSRSCSDIPGLSTFSTPAFSVGMVCQCVWTDDNVNLSGPQRELLTWHWRLGVGMQ